MTVGRAQWLIGDRTMAIIGDRVELSSPPDAIGVIVGVNGFTGVPEVQIIEGQHAGDKVSLWPTQIRKKLPRKG